jgi:hypothetical protein
MKFNNSPSENPILNLANTIIQTGLEIDKFPNLSFMEMEFSMQLERDQLLSKRTKALDELAKSKRREEAIPFFMTHYRRGINVDNLIFALKAIGTVAVIEPLLKIFRDAKSSKIKANGFIKNKDMKNDGFPASALVGIPGGIEKLKQILSLKEFERILLLAHAYGDSTNPDLIKALGYVATPKTIGRLINDLW